MNRKEANGKTLVKAIFFPQKMVFINKKLDSFVPLEILHLIYVIVLY